MKAKVLIPLLFAAVAISTVIFRLKPTPRSGNSPPTVVETVNSGSEVASNTPTSESVAELRKLVIEEYHSSNEHDAITSALVRQLIAERLQTNYVFLQWATNAATSVIMRLVSSNNIPIYGTTGVTVEALRFYKVLARGATGLEADATYDPDPLHEGPLDFRVQGGIHPSLYRVQNGYRLASYQLSPERWGRAPRNVGRTDWSGATRPLDTNQVDRLAHRAFREMTGLDLDSFHVEAVKVITEGVFNPDAVHPGVTATGDVHGRLYSRNDFVYPFASFKYGDLDSVRVLLSGEMLQTSAGHGEFVSLSSFLNEGEAIFELGEKFLGQGTWEQAMLDNVRALNTEERGQIYRRIFEH